MARKKTEEEYRSPEEVDTHLLDQICKPGDIKAFGKADYQELADELKLS